MSDPVTQAQMNLSSTTIDSENTALNVLVGFLTVAQRRGAFTLDEAAKIFECIKFFQKNTKDTTAAPAQNTVLSSS